MLAAVSAAQSLINIAFVGTVSFVLIAMGLRVLFAAKRGRRLRSSAWTWLTPGVVGLVAATYTALFELQFDHQSISIAFVLLVVLAFLIVALALLVIGYRGHRVGDHPFCRKCGFDLFGRPEGTIVCGECGSDLDAKRAIVVGEPKRRPFLMSAGLVLAILTLAVGANVMRSDWPAMSRLAIGSWYAMKPESWLLADMKGGSLADREFRRRWKKGALSNNAIETYLARHLAMTGSTWNLGGTNYAIREEWANGNVSETLVRNGMAAAMNLQLEAAAQATPGECVRYLIRTNDMSLCHLMQRSLGETCQASITNRIVRINGTPVADGKIADDLFAVPKTSLILAGAGTRVDVAGLPLVVGQEATIDVSLTLTLTVRAPGRAVLTETRDYAFTDKVRIVDASQMYCTQPMVAAPDPADPLGARIPVPGPQPHTDLMTVVIAIQDGHSTLSLFGEIPAIAADLYMKHDGKETYLGQVVNSDSIDAELELDFAPPEEATFILRPNNAIGVKLFSPLQTHQGEIEIAAEQVQRRSVSE